MTRDLFRVAVGITVAVAIGVVVIPWQVAEGVARTIAPHDPDVALAEMQQLYGAHLVIRQYVFDRSEPT